MGLPAYSLSNISDAQEVWDMFWQCARYLNGNIDWSNDVDLGTEHDYTYTSRNIKPHKIRWSCTNGHDHGSIYGAGPISWHGLRKRHIDLNSADILWQDYFGNQWDQDSFLMYPGYLSITTDGSGNGNVALPTNSPRCNNNAWDFMGTGIQYDSLWSRRLQASEDVLGMIACVDSDSAATSNTNMSLKVYDNSGTYTFYLYGGDATTTYRINVILFVRCSSTL